MSGIVIVDYQMGNLRSVQKGLERVGASAVISDDPERVARAEKIVLPGVGAFRDAIHELRRRDLVTPLREAIAADKPFLGICLGLQLLFDVSEEGGEHEGLGVIPGRVVRFEVPAPLKVPHMGWNQVVRRQRGGIMESIDDGTYFYFVHSYHVVPSDASCWALESDYGGPFCAAVRRGRLLATQFHPEKSQESGLRLLQAFAQMSV
ncbi:MAG: imidazole glycerol phosphate synthase subunit HisH [Pirellulales bacterium]